MRTREEIGILFGKSETIILDDTPSDFELKKHEGGLVLDVERFKKTGEAFMVDVSTQSK